MDHCRHLVHFWRGLDLGEETFNMMFTVGAGVLLYLTLRATKGSLFALGVTVLTMLNPQIFFWSTQIITEGFSLFFLTLTLYCLKSKKRYLWFIAGIAMGLTLPHVTQFFFRLFNFYRRINCKKKHQTD